MNLDILKEPRDVVTEHIDTQNQDDKENEADEMRPDVPRLRVKSEHALETAAEGVHLRAMVVLQELVVAKPVGETIKGNSIPRPVHNLFDFHFDFG